MGFAVSSQTDFSCITANFLSAGLYRGFDFSRNITNVINSQFTWTSAAQLIVPHNELRDFPGLGDFTYINNFLLDESTTVSRSLPLLRH